MLLFRMAESFASGEGLRCRFSALVSVRPHRAGLRAVALVLGVLVSASTMAVPAAFAQDKPIQIGVLALGPRFLPEWTCGQASYQIASVQARKIATPVYVTGLIEELSKLNYVEDRPENAGKPGRRFAIDLRTGTLAQLRTAARDLAAKRVDFIVAIATAAVRVAQAETKGSGIPILMTGVSDPVQYGFVESLARPGGVITGVSHQMVQGSAKRVEQFKQMLPNLQRMVAMRTPGYQPSDKSMEEVREAAERLKIEVLDWPIKSRADVQAAMDKIEPDNSLGIMILPDSLSIANLDLILETSLARRVPAFAVMDYMATWGAVATSGPSALQAGNRAAGYIDRIVKGAKPGDLPILPVDPEFVVNLKSAQCLGITVPLEVLGQADRVIR